MAWTAGANVVSHAQGFGKRLLMEGSLRANSAMGEI